MLLSFLQSYKLLIAFWLRSKALATLHHDLRLFLATRHSSRCSPDNMASLIDRDFVILDGSFDGIRLRVDPFQFFERSTLSLDAKEVPASGFNDIPADEYPDVHYLHGPSA